MKNQRINRISEEVKKVVSELLYNGLKDPRVHPLTSVTNVEVTRDLSFAKIYVSVLGTDSEKKETIEGLLSAKGFIRKEIAKKVDLRVVPVPIFVLDESIEKAMYLTNLINKVSKEDEMNKENNHE
ncbi:MAG: 30S ribosome-binding factor RbfA [Tissierellia bacterium]|jgi:ribosome-binding factor A|nr:30S ribosome-binding factor RbfA [Tissierellia bacterium]